MKNIGQFPNKKEAMKRLELGLFVQTGTKVLTGRYGQETSVMLGEQLLHPKKYFKSEDRNPHIVFAVGMALLKDNILMDGEIAFAHYAVKKMPKSKQYRLHGMASRIKYKIMSYKNELKAVEHRINKANVQVKILEA